jgi:hypothetical protein
MLGLETVAKIRRAYFVRQKSIKAICRELRVSRKVVRKVLRSDATEFRYERGERPLPRIGPWQDTLDEMLTSNEAKPVRERLTLIRVFEALRVLGYEGGYDAVRRYARAWQRDRAATSVGAFIPLSFAPGEAYQFDWSHEVVLINGTTVTVKVAHVRLCHSRMLFVRAYPRETQEMVFDAHDRAFAFFKGACTRGIYDNMGEHNVVWGYNAWVALSSDRRLPCHTSADSYSGQFVTRYRAFGILWRQLSLNLYGTGFHEYWGEGQRPYRPDINSPSIRRNYNPGYSHAPTPHHSEPVHRIAAPSPSWSNHPPFTSATALLRWWSIRIGLGESGNYPG